MIDFESGRIVFNNIEISKDSKLTDFEKYDNTQVVVRDRGNGRGRVSLVKPIVSNEVQAYVDLYIDESNGTRVLTIYPVTSEEGRKKVLEASKNWLKGFDKFRFTEDEISIFGRFEWGYICAMVKRDQFYGEDGGEIKIHYE